MREVEKYGLFGKFSVIEGSAEVGSFRLRVAPGDLQTGSFPDKWITPFPDGFRTNFKVIPASKVLMLSFLRSALIQELVNNHKKL